MNFCLKNGSLSAWVDSLGGQLRSLCLGQREYLWQGDPAIWPDTAPVLFPVVARQLGDRYRLDGRTYEMPMHGFAKDREFTPAAQSQDSLTLVLEADERTLVWYPFRFRFTQRFLLDPEGLRTEYRVENWSQEDMPFSIGTHTGFQTPAGGEFYLEFAREEHAERWYLEDEIIAGKEPGLEGRLLPLRKDTFDRGALIYKGLGSPYVTLRGPDRSVRVDLTGWDYLGVWAKPGAPYVCIEPWNGLASSLWSSQDIWEKEGIRRLSPGETACFSLNIRIM